MGRPRITQERRVATAVRLPESVHQRLHRVADERDVSANRIVTRAVTEYLDRLPSTEEALGAQPPAPSSRRSSSRTPAEQDPASKKSRKGMSV